LLGLTTTSRLCLKRFSGSLERIGIYAFFKGQADHRHIHGCLA
jgi:hypothetical protein